MKKQFKNYFRAFLTLSKSEQRGIIVLSALILLVVLSDQLLPLVINHKTKNQTEFIAEIKAFQQEQQRLADSVFLAKMQAKGKLDSSMAIRKLKPVSFNPNGLPEENWLAMGLSEKQVSTIKNYESKGGKFKTKEDLKKIYGISEAEYMVLEPFINIPEVAGEKESDKDHKKKPLKTASQPPPFKLTELNSADSALIVDNLKFPSWIASRIVKYRNLLGGFYSANQLFEVYGIDSSEVVKRIGFIETDPSRIKKIDLNQAGFKQVLHHPYISYQLTQSIFNYRSENKKFKSVNELRTEQLVSDSLFQKLHHYFTTR